MKFKLTAFLIALAWAQSASASTLFGVTNDNRLVSFDSSSPSSFLSSVSISGLRSSDGVTADTGARIINLAWNPQAGTFYGIDTNANIYQVSSSGSTILISNTFSPSGFDAGFGYDPISGNLIFGSETGEHFSISSAGTFNLNSAFAYGAGDGNAGSTPSIFGVAFDPDFGTGYFLDSSTGSLAISNDISLSELFTRGSLGIAVTRYGDLTVDADGNLFASLSTDGLTSGLYSINSTTGEATLVGNFGAGVGLSAIAVPEPSSLLLGGIGCLFLLRRRRP